MNTTSQVLQQRLKRIQLVKKGIDGCILVDLDKKQPPSANYSLVLSLLRLMGLTPVWIRYDRTRRGWHMVIKVKEPLNYSEILIAQATLGDDCRRSALNFRRLQHGIWLNQLFVPCNTVTLKRNNK